MLQSSLNKMDGVEAVKGLSSLGPDSNAIIGALIQGYFFIVSVGALPIRLILRKNLGERSFTIFGFIVSMCFYIFYGIFLGGFGVISLVTQFFGEIEITWLTNIRIFLLNPFFIFMLVVISKAVTHFKDIFRKIRTNQIQYSYFRGESIYFKKRKGGKKWGFEIDERFIRMVIEPLAVLRIGLLIFLVAAGVVSFNYFYILMTKTLLFFQPILIWTAILGLTLVFSALCLFLEEFGIMMRIRNSVLDLIDADIDMQIVMKKRVEMASGQIEMPEELRTLQTDNTFMGEFLSMAPDEVASFPEITEEK